MNPEMRYELKFIMYEQGFADALQWIYQLTHARKAYPSRWVNSLYFDDINFTQVQDNLAGISKRRKIRLRWYHEDADIEQISSPVLEVKQRESRLGNKVKYPVPTLQKLLFDLSFSEMTPHLESSLSNTLAMATLFNDHIISTLHVSYNREYFESPDGLRITFDRDIRFSITPPNLCLRDIAQASYPPIIMELKFPAEMKDQVSRLLQPLSLTAKRHSKYLAGLATFGHTTYI